MDISAESLNGSVSSSSMKKKLIHPKRGWREFPGSAGHFPDDQKKTRFPAGVFVSQGPAGIPGFSFQHAEQ